MAKTETLFALGFNTYRNRPSGSTAIALPSRVWLYGEPDVAVRAPVVESFAKPNTAVPPEAYTCCACDCARAEALARIARATARVKETARRLGTRLHRGPFRTAVPTCTQGIRVSLAADRAGCCRF